MRNLTVSQVARDLGIPLDSTVQVTDYQVDSRKISPGGLFFALPGERVDGHAFLADARQRGAIGAVVERRYQGPDHGLLLFPVEDVMASLHALAKKDLIEAQAQVVGITGSVGKTTTKDFVAELLSAKYKVGKAPFSYNTKLTLPISILNREGGEEVFVLEMGMEEPGDIKRLLTIAEPDVALVTKVALAHSAFFPDGLEGIAKGKAEIFLSPKLRTAVFYQKLLEYPCFAQIPGEKLLFSLEDASADYFLSLQEERYALDERGVRAYQFDLPFKETHLLHNFLAAASVARAMKLEWDQINSRIPFLKTPKMRFEKFEKGGISFINDAYNANPESMRAAFSGLPVPSDGGKRIGVLGTMRPLGSFSRSAHIEIGKLAREYFDLLLVLGEEAHPLFESFQEAKKPAEFFTDIPSLTKRLEALMRPGDVVLVKGSRTMKMETIFEGL
jgi:UDP-N-acetylmuramoyl-tripeptide--D-alanyl-D-alanine ligase